MSENTTLTTLSEEATKEILGDQLCFVLAFGINGEIVPILPHGIDVKPDGFQNKQLLDYIDITFKLPPEVEKQALTGDATVPVSNAQKLMTLATYICVRGGKIVTCNSPC